MYSRSKLFSLIVSVCSLIAACGGQGESKAVDVVAKELNSQNIEQVFSTYLLEQYRTNDEIDLLRGFLSIADWAKDGTTPCSNGGVIKNLGSFRFEFDQCATSKGIIYSGVIEQNFIGARAQLNAFYKNVRYRFSDDTLDQELSGNYLAGYMNPNTFSYTYLRSGIASTYQRETLTASINSNGFNFELKDVDQQGKPVQHVVTAKDGSNLSITRLVDGSYQLQLRNIIDATPVSAKQYSSSEVARILATERKSK